MAPAISCAEFLTTTRSRGCVSRSTRRNSPTIRVAMTWGTGELRLVRSVMSHCHLRFQHYAGATPIIVEISTTSTTRHIDLS